MEKKRHIYLGTEHYDDACVSLLVLLTNNAIFLFVLQVINRDEVTLHHGHIAAVLAGDDAGLPVQSHLVVVLHRGVLLVGDLQGALGNIVDLTRTDG